MDKDRIYMTPGEKINFWKDACIASLRGGSCGVDTAIEYADTALREMCARFETKVGERVDEEIEP